VLASVSDVALVGQLGVEHTVPFGHFSHAPEASQAPVVPQVVGSWAGQPGSRVPATTFPHRPVPGWQAWQVGQLAVPQQTSSTQWPFVHSLLPVQPAPSAPFIVHVPTGRRAQKCVLAQSLSLEHVVRHAFVAPSHL